MSTVRHHSSVVELKRIFSFLNEELSSNSLPEPSFDFPDRGNRKLTSWFGLDEINKKKVPVFRFTEDSLQCSSYELIQQVVIMMVHLSNYLSDTNDVSPEGYYNKNFKTKGEEFGLIVEQSKYRGWSEISLSDRLTQLADDLCVDFSAFPEKRKKVKKEVREDKYDSLTVNKETKQMLKTFCTLTGMSMIEVTERAFERYMYEFKK